MSSCYKKLCSSIPDEGDWAYLTICFLLVSGATAFNRYKEASETTFLGFGHGLSCGQLPWATASRNSHSLLLQRVLIVSCSVISVSCTCGSLTIVSSCMPIKFSLGGNSLCTSHRHIQAGLIKIFRPYTENFM